MNFNELLSICDEEQKVSIHPGSLKNPWLIRGTKEEFLKSDSTFTNSLSKKEVKDIKAENNILKVSIE